VLGVAFLRRQLRELVGIGKGHLAPAFRNDPTTKPAELGGRGAPHVTRGLAQAGDP
jgi:hypothetical protein